jgi:hypothetical protein
LRLSLLPSLLAALLLAAACGGDDESASEQWSSDFCSAAADWRTSLEDTISQFQSPSDLTAESLRGAVDDGLEATQTFVDEVRRLGPPETEAQQEAAGIIDSMTAQIESTADDVRSTFDSGDDSLPAMIQKLSQAGGQIAQMGQDLQTSLSELENLNGGEELKDAIDSNEDCDAARAGS